MKTTESIWAGLETEERMMLFIQLEYVGITIDDIRQANKNCNLTKIGEKICKHDKIEKEKVLPSPQILGLQYLNVQRR